MNELRKQMPRKVLTLVLIYKCNRILLGLKKRGFGSGKWNGFGGKLQFGETIEAAAVREVKEECNLTVRDLKKIGLLSFEFVDNPELLEVHVFASENFEGTVKESEEMKPEWYSFEEIPYDKMWADDKHWFPLFLNGKKFKGHFKFKGHENILEYELKPVNDDSLLHS